MKSKTIFQDVAYIELEGIDVLQLLEQSDDRAEYQVIGFNNPVIRIIDYRMQGLQAIKQALDTEDTTNFPELFCSPSIVTILEKEEGQIVIELNDNVINSVPLFMLWIAIGIQDPIPYYSYPFFRLAELERETYAFVSLFNYRRYQKYFDSVESNPLPVQGQIQSQ